jgi:hypothetical protein
MAISSFESFQYYDTAFAFSVQSAYGTGSSPDKYLKVGSFEINPLNQEIESYGTSASRGVREDQRTKSGTMASFGFVLDLVNNSDVQALIGWALGTSTAPDDAVKFATIAARYGDSDGVTLEDCAITTLSIVLEHSQVAKLVVSGSCFTDWDTTGSPVAFGTPAAGTPLKIEDSDFTIQGTELPVDSCIIQITNPILPVFAQNSYPVSFKATPSREVTVGFDLPATDTTYELLGDLRDDSTGDITVDMNGITVTFENTYLLNSTGAGMTGLGVGPVEAAFRATKPDAGSAEVTFTYV